MPDKPWNWGQFGFSNNPNIKLEWLKQYPTKSNQLYFGKFGLSCNDAITIEWLEKYPDNGKCKCFSFQTPSPSDSLQTEKPWHWGAYGLSFNPSITLEWIEKYPMKSWQWGYGGLSSNLFTAQTKINEKRFRVLRSNLPIEVCQIILDFL